jgi:hypothetical protein
MTISVSVIRKISEGGCMMMSDWRKSIRQRANINALVFMDGQQLLNMDIIIRHDDATVSLTEHGYKLLDRSLPAKTIFKVLRCAPMRMVGNSTRPGMVRRTTIDEMIRMGLIKSDGIEITLTEAGLCRLLPDPIHRLVFSVPSSKLEAVNAAVAGVLENDHDRHHE